MTELPLCFTLLEHLDDQMTAEGISNRPHLLLARYQDAAGLPGHSFHCPLIGHCKAIRGATIQLHLPFPSTSQYQHISNNQGKGVIT